MLAEGANELVVPLKWQDRTSGLSVVKTFRFHRGSFEVDLEYTVDNAGTEPYRAANYLQIQRHYEPPKRSMFNVDSYSFFGPVVYNGSKYEKLKVDDLAKTPFTQTVAKGWMAAIQHHFLAATIPPATETWSYAGLYAEGRFLISAIGPLPDCRTRRFSELQIAALCGA